MNLSDKEKELLKEAGLWGDKGTISRQIERKYQARKQWTTINQTGPRPQPPATPVRIMLFGEAGAGKSAVGNLLLGNGSFRTSETSGTRQCQEATGTYGNGRMRIEVLEAAACMSLESDEYWAFVKEVINKMDGVDVFILVVNTSSRRIHDMGINMLKQMGILKEHTVKQFMVVGTHSAAHYSNKAVSAFLQDVTEDPAVKCFMDDIKNQVVLIELGTGPVTAEAAKSGTGVYEKEREQARDMVMSMVYNVMNNNNADQHSGKALYLGKLEMVLVGSVLIIFLGILMYGDANYGCNGLGRLFTYVWDGIGARPWPEIDLDVSNNH